MKMSCGDLRGYLDDTLEGARREAFEDHLLGCASCQAGLEDSMQLLAAGAELARSPNRPRAAPIREQARASRRLRAWLGGGMAFAAAAAALLLWFVLPRERGPSVDDRVAAALAPRRSLEARLPYGALDRHRPYDVDRGASRPETLSSALVAEVERARSPAAYAAVLLANRSFDQAEALLARAGSGEPPDDQLELARAALALARKQEPQALEHLDGVLARSPGNSVALWNRALALQRLQLPFAAAEAYEVVARLGEPGWSAEAAERGALLRKDVQALDKRWRTAKEACLAMWKEGPLPERALVLAHAYVCRPDFYQAVRVARTPDALRALAPIAAALDEYTGNTAAADHLRRVIAVDPARRARAVEAYGRVIDPKVPVEEKRRLIEQLRASGQHDLVSGAIGWSELRDELGEEYIRHAREMGDPYYAEVAVEKSARLKIARGDLRGAEAELRAAVDACRARDVELYCSTLYRALVDLYVDHLHRPSDALVTAEAALERSRRLGLYWDQWLIFDYMAKAERLARALALMRAHLREATLRVGSDCEQRRYKHELVATDSIDDLRFEQARRDLAEAPDCDAPPTPERARVIAELARAGGSPEEARALGAALVQSRAKWARTAGQRAYFDAIEGRLVAARDPDAARPLLRRAIETADGAGRGDADAAIARRDAYGALLVLTAGAGDPAASLALLAEAAGTSPREGACVAGVMVDAERVLAIVRDARGTLAQHFDPRGRTGPALEAAKLIPGELQRKLDGCARIDVLALAPVFGQPGLLPAELAWSYRGRPGGAPAAPPAGAPTVVTVADVTPPPELRLDPLAPRRLAPIPGATHVEVTGAEATPARVARELARADAIEIHAHGFVKPAISDAAMIALSPQGDGRFALDAREIAGLSLPRAPLVMLGACHAGYTAPYRHEPWGLPRAFLIAGARAVIASRDPIPDAEAGEFLRALGARILGGTDPAAALRDERVRRLAADPKSWIGTVLLFD